MGINWDEIPTRRGKANFNNLLSVLRREVPRRPTLFEFFMNERLYTRLAPEYDIYSEDPLTVSLCTINAFYRLGYDYAVVEIPGFSFKQAGKVNRRKLKSVSQNEGSVISSRAEFDSFPWPNPDDANFKLLDRLAVHLPDQMKLIIPGPSGLLENAVHLIGYTRLCLMTLDDPRLTEDIFEQIGSRLVRFYQKVCQHESVGAIISNDDWGFKTHTIFSTRDMRRFVFPWHKQMVEVAHEAGRPAILHSCGNFKKIIEDVIEDMKYDGRHSYEDNIMPVEEFYEEYHQRISILGGIDMDFICRSSPEEVYARSQKMLELAAGRGSYALGTGNSVPDYVPDVNYFAIIRAALDQW